MIDEQREREITRKAQLAIMPRQELNAHAYLLEQEQEEYEAELAKLRAELDREREKNQKLCEEMERSERFWKGQEERLYWWMDKAQQLQSAQQEIERLRNLARQEREQDRQWFEQASANVQRMEKEFSKALEALKMISEVFYADAEKTAERMREIAENTIEELEGEYGTH